jgi:hypothetical protein
MRKSKCKILENQLINKDIINEIAIVLIVYLIKL